MSILWIIVLIVVLCSIWFLQPLQEGFLVQPTTWDALRNFFHYQASPIENPTGIPIEMNPGLESILPSVDAAIDTPGFPTQPGLFRKLMDTTDPNKTEDEKCRALGHPRLLTASRATRTADQVGKEMGCGWWFFSDSDKPSLAAYGYGPQNTEGMPAGPLYPKDIPTGGTWIWDISRANYEEEIKRCAAIQTCSLVSASDGCGYCVAANRAVPVDANGSVKYPTKPEEYTMDGSCTTKPLAASDCSDITIVPRDFTGDFDYDINGNPIRNDLYNRVRNPESLHIRDPCLNESGQLTKACILQMCLELAQCTYAKGLHRILFQDGILTDTDKLALYYVKRKGGLLIPIATMSSLGKSDAEYIMQRLYTLATSGPPSTQRSAALWLLNETPFNDCDFEESYSGPYPLQCVQREFRKAGCQASGSEYPSNTTLSKYNTMPYATMKVQFRDLYANMNRDVKNVHEQDDTIKKCLGIDILRAKDEVYEENPNMCRERGIEIWYITIPTIGHRLLYAQTISNTFLDISGTLLNQKGGVHGYIARTYVELSGTPVTITLDAGSGYSFWINRQQVLAVTGSITSTTSRFQYNLEPYTRSEVEIRYEGTGILNPALPTLTLTPPMNMYLAQSIWKPFLSLIARKDGFVDDNHFLEFAADVKRPMAQLVGRWSIPINGLAIKSLPSRGIWMTAARTITCMIYWNGFTGQANLWRMDQGTGSTAETILTLRILDKRPVLTLTSGTSTFRLQSAIALSNPNKWLHIAVVFGEGLGATKLYINGVDRSQDAVATGTIDIHATFYTRMVLGGPGFDGSYGWFHVYDTALRLDQIQRDIQYDDPTIKENADVVLLSTRNIRT